VIVDEGDVDIADEDSEFGEPDCELSDDDDDGVCKPTARVAEVDDDGAVNSGDDADDDDVPAAKRRRGRKPAISDLARVAVDRWLASLKDQPTEAEVAAALVDINNADLNCIVTSKRLQGALDMFNREQMGAFLSNGVPPTIDLRSKTFYFCDDEIAEISKLLESMPHTSDRRVAPLIERFNAVRAAARVPLVTNTRMTNKCSKLREARRAVRSAKEPVWPLSIGRQCTRARCVLTARAVASRVQLCSCSTRSWLANSSTACAMSRCRWRRAEQL